MVQTISWFIESDGKHQRVEEELVAISDKELSFTRKGEKFVLKYDLSIAPYVFGDVVFMIQQGPTLTPLRLPFTLDQALLTQDEIDEIVKAQVRDLETKVEESRGTIRRLLHEKSDVIDPQFKIFDQLTEFRQFLQGKVVELVEEKVEQQKQLLEAKKVTEPAPPAPPTPLQPAPAPILQPTPAIIVQPAPAIIIQPAPAPFTPQVSPPPQAAVPPPTPPSPPPPPTLPKAEPVEVSPPAEGSYKKEESSYRMFFNSGGKKRWT